MKLMIKQDVLAAAVATAARIVPKAPTLPVLGNIALRAQADLVEIVASDLSVFYRSQVPAQVSTPGRVLLDAKRLAEIAKGCSGDEVTFEGEPNALTIKSGKTRYKLIGLGDQDFPKIPEPPEDMRAYPAALFRQALSSVAYAMCSDETRYHLNGVSLTLGDGVLQAVATDGHRLAVRGEASEKDPCVLIPFAAVHHLLRGLPNEGELHVGTSGVPEFLYVGDADDDARFSMRTLDATFPPWRAILPKDPIGSVRLVKDIAKGALSRVAPLADGKTEGCSLEGSADALKVSTRSIDGHEADEAVETKLLRGASDFRSSFCLRYLIEALEPCGETFELDYKGELDPIEIRSEDYRVIIMPMRS